MIEKEQNEEIDNIDTPEENEIVSKPLTPQQLIHQSKAPLFANANRFGKWSKWAMNNNRQRPWRVASRWR